MEEGALRVDANVSVHKIGEPLGTRTEIKNIGSVRGVAGAVRHEIDRQRALLSRGATVLKETRAWDAQARATVPMRDKELVLDYRFMPEPNLPPLRLNLKTRQDDPHVLSVPLIQESIPELPEQSRLNLVQQHNIRPETAIQLVNEPRLLDYFNKVTTDKTRDPTKVANLIINDLLTVLNKAKINPEDCKVTAVQLAEVVDLLLGKKINLETTKRLLQELLIADETSPSRIVKEKGWFLITNEDEIQKRCEEVIVSNPEMVKQYKDGKTKVFKALLGVLAKNTQGMVDMAVASKKLEEMLKNYNKNLIK